MIVQKPDSCQIQDDYDTCKELTLEEVYNLDYSERQYYIIDKDAGTYIDIRQNSSRLKNIPEQKINQQSGEGIWDGYWQQVEEQNKKLQLASQKGDLETIQALLDRKQTIYPVDINYKGQDDWTTVHICAFYDQMEALLLMIHNKANLEAQSKQCSRPIHIASMKGNIGILTILISYKADLDAQDNCGKTALHYACMSGNYETVLLLLTHNAKYNIIDNEGKVAVEYTFNDKILDLFKKKIKENARKILKNKSNSTNYSTISCNDFKFFKLLGKGGFGEVYLVQYKKDDKFYAMKMVRKPKVKEYRLEKYLKTEKEVQSKQRHPFITRLYFAFQTATKLFMVLELCEGGSLGNQLYQYGNFPEEVCRIYLAEIVLAIEALHKDNYIYRDLKPENVLLDREGHVKITDFGLAKKDVKNQTDTFLGTPPYIAPEIAAKTGHNRMVDWWTLGVLFYEILVGVLPFFDRDRKLLMKQIQNKDAEVPESLSDEAKDLILQLLQKDPKQRLGIEGAQQVKQHSFFKDINWEEVYNRQLQPPKVSSKGLPKKELKIFINKNIKGHKIKDWTMLDDQSPTTITD